MFATTNPQTLSRDSFRARGGLAQLASDERFFAPDGTTQDREVVGTSCAGVGLVCPRDPAEMLNETSPSTGVYPRVLRRAAFQKPGPGSGGILREFGIDPASISSSGFGSESR